MRRFCLALAGLVVAFGGGLPRAQAPAQNGFSFRTGIDLINVTATVTDQSGRFVPGLNKDDFRVFDDNQLQAVTHFSAERVPVSLGILVDTSASMDGDKIVSARAALQRFLSLLSDPQDEVFLYRFDNAPELVEGWTYDKARVAASLDRLHPRGATSLYDAVADGIQLAGQAHNKKKALVIISDGNDTTSRTDIIALKQLIRQSEVLVYAVGIDAVASPRRASGSTFAQRGGSPFRPPSPVPAPQPPSPSPFPGAKKPPKTPTPDPGGSSSGGNGGGPPSVVPLEDRVNVAALRDLTDDSGGRTEIIKSPVDLDPATTGIADELSKQYYMGYPAPPEKDGRWHTLRVEVRQPTLRVRARRGYVAGK